MKSPKLAAAKIAARYAVVAKRSAASAESVIAKTSASDARADGKSKGAAERPRESCAQRSDGRIDHSAGAHASTIIRSSAIAEIATAIT